MTSNIRRLQSDRFSLSLFIVLILPCITMPSFADTWPMRLEPPELHGADSKPYRGLKVCLIVKDGRHESVVKTQMLGRYGIPGKRLTLLKNRENLDSLLAYSIADSLEFAGYEVVSVHPSRPEALSKKNRKKQKGMKDEFKLARQSQTKTDREETAAIRDRETSAVSFKQVSGSLAVQEKEEWTNGADAVLEVTIDKFSSDFGGKGLGLQFWAWSSVTITVASVESEQLGNLVATNAYGWGYRKNNPVLSFGVVFIPRLLRNMLNASYETLVVDMESVFLSDEFFEVMTPEGDSVRQTGIRTVPAQQTTVPLQTNAEEEPVEQALTPKPVKIESTPSQSADSESATDSNFLKAQQTNAEEDRKAKLRAELEERMKSVQP